MSEVTLHKGTTKLTESKTFGGKGNLNCEWDIRIEHSKFAMVPAFVKRSRKIWNVNDDVKRQTNFVKMLLCKKWYGYINFVTERGETYYLQSGSRFT